MDKSTTDTKTDAKTDAKAKTTKCVKCVSGIVTGFYYYGNGVVFRLGHKTKLWIPQSFLPQKPYNYIALKIKATATLNKYYGGKFKTIYVVKKPSDFTIEEKDFLMLDADPEKKIKNLFKALGKNSIYKKLFSNQNKKRKKTTDIKTLAQAYSPDFIFKLVNKKYLDFLSGLAFFYLLHGIDKKIPFSGYAEALSWIFWTLYKEEKTSKINLKKAFQSIQDTFGLAPPDPKAFIKYLLYKNKFYFYIPQNASAQSAQNASAQDVTALDVTDQNANQNQNTNPNTNPQNTKTIIQELIQNERYNELAEKLHYYDWKYKTMKEQVETFLEKALNISSEIKTNELFDENQEIDLEKLYHFILKNQITVIVGPPGSGKSTLTRTLSYIFEKHGKKVYKTAPTGFASLNLDGITIAKAFDIFKHSENSNSHSFLVSQADIIFIDETSQIPLDVFFIISKKISPNQKIVFLGDPNQLSPVEGENIFEFLIEKAKKYDKLIELKKTYRFLPEKKTVIYLVPSSQDLIYATACLYLHYAILQEKKTLVMTPYHRSFTGTQRLNLLIKTLYNLYKNLQENLQKNLHYQNFKNKNYNLFLNAIKKVIFAKDINNDYFLEKNTEVIITKNIYSDSNNLICVNKDLGTIIEIDEQNNEVYVKLKRNDFIVRVPKNVVYPAYALEFFASQGQESDCSIVVIPKGYIEQVNSDENLKKALYTTATRAKKYTFFLTTQDNHPDQLELLLKNLNIKIETIKSIEKENLLEKLKNYEKKLLLKIQQKNVEIIQDLKINSKSLNLKTSKNLKLQN